MAKLTLRSSSPRARCARTKVNAHNLLVLVAATLASVLVLTHREVHNPSDLSLKQFEASFVATDRAFASFASSKASSPQLFRDRAIDNQGKHWRKQVRQICANSSALPSLLLDVVHTLNQQGSNDMQQSAPKATMPQPPSPTIRPCRNIIFDLGANRGDTLGHVLDAGWPAACFDQEKNDLKNRLVPHFDASERMWTLLPRTLQNGLTQHLRRLFEEHHNNDTNVGSEEYCYYGIEGNPVFTERLRDLERHVMSMMPRPIMHAHFLTESVAAGEDGSTLLYLDKVNVNTTFWGSSIFADHVDVRRSQQGAASGEKGATSNQQPVGVPVRAYTLGTLLRQALPAAALHDGGRGSDGGAPGPASRRHHLILKIDIEGAEYPVLQQAMEEGTVCRFARQDGHRVDAFVEYHSKRVVGPHAFEGKGKRKELEKALSRCGVVFHDLANWWA